MYKILLQKYSQIVRTGSLYRLWVRWRLLNVYFCGCLFSADSEGSEFLTSDSKHTMYKIEIKYRVSEVCPQVQSTLYSQIDSVPPAIATIPRSVSTANQCI